MRNSCFLESCEAKDSDVMMMKLCVALAAVLAALYEIWFLLTICK